jgi:hypothetical protein
MGYKKGALRCDNRGEFQLERLNKGLLDHRVGMQYTAPLSPATNGCAERMKGNLLNEVRGMLKSSGLPVEYGERW